MNHNLNPFTLTVVDLFHTPYKIYCLGRDHSVEFLKFALEQQIGIPRKNIRLIADSRELENHWTLEESGIDRSSKIIMIINVRSGR
jgi:Ubiquitin family